MAAARASTPVFVVIAVFGIIAFSFSIAGERRSSSGTQRTDPFTHQTYCVNKTDIASVLGIVACLFLFATQVMLMVITRCLCCGTHLAPGGSRVCAIILLIAMWISYFLAESCLITAAREYSFYDGNRSSTNVSCKAVRRVLFIAGAIFVVSTTILNLLYYMCFARASVKRIQQVHYPPAQVHYPPASNIRMTAHG